MTIFKKILIMTVFVFSAAVSFTYAQQATGGVSQETVDKCSTVNSQNYVSCCMLNYRAPNCAPYQQSVCKADNVSTEANSCQEYTGKKATGQSSGGSFVAGCTDTQCNVNNDGTTNNSDPFANPAAGGTTTTGGGNTVTAPTPITPGNCSAVNAGNYQSCCLDPNATVHATYTQCNNYENSVAAQAGGGGTVPTGAINNDPSSSSYASNTSSVAYDTAVTACKNIKFNSLLDILIWIKCVITSAIIPLLFTLAFLYFLWNIFKFIRASEKTEKEDSKKAIYWGMIALFVMLGVWGIIRIVSNTLGIQTGIPLLETKDSALATPCTLTDGTPGIMTSAGCVKK